MRILICNDDGIEASGLARLVAAASALSGDVWVVAPDGKRTAAGSSLTIARPLTMRRLKPNWYACSGTPADCVVSAMTWLFADTKKPDLVLSGVNDGRNVAEDLAYSGTLGIAREATFWGVPAIGFSRVKNPDFTDGDDQWLGALIVSLWQSRADWAAEGHWLSINLPTSLPAEIRQPRIGRDKIARKAEIVESDGDRTVITVPRGRAHDSQPGDENDAIDAGFISINRLNWLGETRLDERFLDGIPRQRQTG
ncbi:MULTISPECIES: 5'/3'-nucleotidase SurE [Mesorhizobium]|uniref:5'-nucleotidase SurE n=1 Tax=Mesorhizobium ciceri biovar biserrulae (strain HAMBI 2942 / LMG 23838 / WSM1271) TaxID=765698 RepID=E8T8H5_MESCW|nr:MULTISPECIES: 5'/3'-nucleotidase SurE [Mesorhizobium]ADV10631.1 stationary-phase survival protein SurE [Mesorhizobium ciceri biovar biserrulae WSM1271]MBZ9718618.1 stationary-phase survival protein SurE [Mesorhizobium sp. AD1-1]